MATRVTPRNSVYTTAEVHPERHRSRSSRYSLAAKSPSDQITFWAQEFVYHKREAQKWKARFNRLCIITLLLTGIILYNLNSSSPITSEPRKLNLPLSHEPNNTNSPVDGKNGLLIPAKRRELYTELNGLYSNLTLAHFGWLLQSPFKSLNYDQHHRRLNLFFGNNSAAHAQNRADLEDYVQNYLIAPWREDSAFCSTDKVGVGVGLMDPDICKLAVRRFEKQYVRFLDEGFVKGWERRVIAAAAADGGGGGDGDGGWSKWFIKRSVRRAEMDERIRKCEREVVGKYEGLRLSERVGEDREYEACRRIGEEYGVKGVDEEGRRGDVEL